MAYPESYQFTMPAPITTEQDAGTTGPQFREATPTQDPTKYTIPYPSDTPAYAILDNIKSPQPAAFPYVNNAAEPVITLADALGPTVAGAVIAGITQAQQIVFHSLGDTGDTRGPKTEENCADKMVADFSETDPKDVPAFMYHLGDVVYSFGQAAYYFDQFYDMYRNYPAPIFAVPGNHDGLVSPLTTGTSLDAFFNNFCAYGSFHTTPEAGELSRTAQIQPGVYFTLEAPFVRILGLYSNCLEDPGVISTQGGTYANLTDVQLTYLETALARAAADWNSGAFTGATIIAVHHPPYVALNPATSGSGQHNGSPIMLAEIDNACTQANFWPHAIFSGHAHNYQRFTRHQASRQTPCIVCGNGGHGTTRLTGKASPALRTPALQQGYSTSGSTVIFENYDDLDYGYLRVIVDAKQLRIEYHPTSDSTDSKTPDDSVTVDLATRQIINYVPVDTPIG